MLGVDSVFTKVASPVLKTLYYSTPLLHGEGPFIGKKHYSYRFAAEKFISVLETAGISCAELPLPEFYGSPEALPAPHQPFDLNHTRPVHLLFRSTEEFRLLKFGYNIGCFAWEFEILNDTAKRDGDPFANQVHMLSICDEIWTPCSFGRDVFLRYGIQNVEVIPAPIAVRKRELSKREALGQLSALSAAPINHNPQWGLRDSVNANQGALQPLYEWMHSRPEADVFLSVFNPGDFRKNMNAMLRGFYYYNQEYPNSVLIVKLVTSFSDERGDLVAQMQRAIASRLSDIALLQCPSILIVPDYLQEEELSALYQLSDFYLCASFCEGQNLPLLEAMSYGTIPIAPRHTAMLDYLEDKNSVHVEFVRVQNIVPHLAAAQFGPPFAINFSDERDIYRALERAGALKASEREEMSGNGIHTIKRLFSASVILEKIANRLAASFPARVEEAA